MAKSPTDGDKLLLLKEGVDLHLSRVGHMLLHLIDGPKLGDLLQISLNRRSIRTDICLFMYIPDVEAAGQCHYKRVLQQPRSTYQA